MIRIIDRNRKVRRGVAVKSLFQCHAELWFGFLKAHSSVRELFIFARTAIAVSPVNERRLRGASNGSVNSNKSLGREARAARHYVKERNEAAILLFVQRSHFGEFSVDVTLSVP